MFLGFLLFFCFLFKWYFSVLSDFVCVPILIFKHIILKSSLHFIARFTGLLIFFNRNKCLHLNQDISALKTCSRCTWMCYFNPVKCCILKMCLLNSQQTFADVNHLFSLSLLTVLSILHGRERHKTPIFLAYKYKYLSHAFRQAQALKCLLLKDEFCLF